MEEADEKEVYYIALYDSSNEEIGYNISYGAANHEVREESRELISEKAKERCKDKTKNPMYGKHHSDETKRLISESRRGELNPMYGTKWNATQRERCGTKGKKLNISDELRQDLVRRAIRMGKMNSKKVICLEDNLTFESATEAAKHYNVHISTLCGHLNGNQHTCRGKHFEYIKEDVQGATTNCTVEMSTTGSGGGDEESS